MGSGLFLSPAPDFAMQHIPGLHRFQNLAPTLFAIGAADGTAPEREFLNKDLWGQLSLQGPRDINLHRPVLTEADRRAFQMRSREEQRQIVSSLKAQIESAKRGNRHSPGENPDGDIGASSPLMIDIPTRPSPNASYEEQVKYFDQMRALAFRTRNPRYLIPPPKGSSPLLYNTHAYDIGELTGDWSPWAATAIDKSNELIATVGGFAGARPPVPRRMAPQQEFASGAPLNPLPGPNVIHQSDAGTPSRPGAGTTPAAIPSVGITSITKPDDHNLPGIRPQPSTPRHKPAAGLTETKQPQNPGQSSRLSAISAARQNAGFPPGIVDPNSRQIIDPKTGALIGEESFDGKRSWRIDNGHVVWSNLSSGKRPASAGVTTPASAMAGSVPINGGGTGSAANEPRRKSNDDPQPQGSSSAGKEGERTSSRTSANSPQIHVDDQNKSTDNGLRQADKSTSRDLDQFVDNSRTIDMSSAPGTATNAAGFPRNGPWFWRQML